MIRLRKLSELCSAEDMAESPVLSGNYHCPLYTALRTTHGIAGCKTLVLGGAECLYYVSELGRSRENGASDAFGVAMGWNEMTFGAEQSVREAFAELVGEYRPEAVIIITTCIPEITNEDMDSLAESLAAEYGIPVAAAHTAHYRQDTAAGTAAVLAACAAMMEETAPNGTVNILGDSLRSFAETEPGRILNDAGVPIGVCLPHSSVRELRKAPGAAVNLVTNADGLELAETMKRRFGTPYVFFGASPRPETVLEAYRKLFSLLDRPLPGKVQELYSRCVKAQESLRCTLAGKSFALGGGTFPPMALGSYLTQLGMHPLLLVLPDIPREEERETVGKLLEKADPYVARRLERAELNELRQQLLPDVFLGQHDRRGKRGGRPGFEGILELFAQLTADPHANDRGEGHGGRRQEDGHRGHDGRHHGGREGRDGREGYGHHRYGRGADT